MDQSAKQWIEENYPELLRLVTSKIDGIPDLRQFASKWAKETMSQWDPYEQVAVDLDNLALAPSETDREIYERLIALFDGKELLASLLEIDKTVGHDWTVSYPTLSYLLLNSVDTKPLAVYWDHPNLPQMLEGIVLFHPLWFEEAKKKAVPGKKKAAVAKSSTVVNKFGPTYKIDQYRSTPDRFSLGLFAADEKVLSSIWYDFDLTTLNSTTRPYKLTPPIIRYLWEAGLQSDGMISAVLSFKVVDLALTIAQTMEEKRIWVIDEALYNFPPNKLRPFLTLDGVDGQTLWDSVSGQPLNSGDAVRVLDSVFPYREYDHEDNDSDLFRQILDEDDLDLLRAYDEIGLNIDQTISFTEYDDNGEPIDDYDFFPLQYCIWHDSLGCFQYLLPHYDITPTALLSETTRYRESGGNQIVVYNRPKILRYLLDSFHYDKADLIAVLYRTDGPEGLIAEALGLPKPPARGGEKSEELIRLRK